MIRDILIVTESDIVKTPCLEVGADEDVSALITDLKDTANNDYTDLVAIGLAANQIGVLKRVIYINDKGYKGALVNPVLLSGKGESVADEMCFSIPGVRVPIKRYKQIKVKHREGTVKLDGMAARAAQHEIDHIDGILITDKNAGIR